MQRSLEYGKYGLFELCFSCLKLSYTRRLLSLRQVSVQLVSLRQFDHRVGST